MYGLIMQWADRDLSQFDNVMFDNYEKRELKTFATYAEALKYAAWLQEDSYRDNMMHFVVTHLPGIKGK